MPTHGVTGGEMRRVDLRPKDINYNIFIYDLMFKRAFLISW
jgi:hypothetical protein